MIKHIYFDIKSMGLLFWIPIFLYIFLIIYIYSICKYEDIFLARMIPTLEFTVPLFAAWWSCFIFYDILEENGKELIFSYPIKRWKIGILKVCIFLILYYIILALFLFVLQQWTSKFIYYPLIVQLFYESYFFAGLGFLCMTITSNSLYSFTVPLLYAATMFFCNETKIKAFNFMSIFLYNIDVVKINQLIKLSIIPLVFGSLFFIFAQIILDKNLNIFTYLQLENVLKKLRELKR
jgi:hypothetical protein